MKILGSNLSNFEAFLRPITLKTEILFNNVCIEESFDTTFNMIYGGGGWNHHNLFFNPESDNSATEYVRQCALSYVKLVIFAGSGSSAKIRFAKESIQDGYGLVKPGMGNI